MRLGLLIDRHDGRATTAAQLAGAAEMAGFDAVWVSHGRLGWPNPFAAVAALAQATRGCAIGVAAIAGELHPLHSAEEIALADHLTAGRLTVALTPAPGVPRNRYTEAVAVVRLALSGRPFRHEGDHWTIPAGLPEHAGARSDRMVQPTPAPAQIRVPVLVAAGSHLPDVQGTFTAFRESPPVAPAETGIHVVVTDIDPAMPDDAIARLNALRAGGFNLALCRLPQDGEALLRAVVRFGRLIGPRLRATRLPGVILNAMTEDER